MKTKDLLRTAVQQFHQTLDGAQAPACWQEELTHESRKLKRLQSACAWAEVPLGDAPKLVMEPLFGSCLDEVTAPSQPDAAPKATPPPRRPTRNAQGDSRPPAAPDGRSTPTPKRASVDEQADQAVPEPVYRHRTLADMPDQCLDTEHVLKLPAEAHGSLLNRLRQADEAEPHAAPANRMHDPKQAEKQPRQQSDDIAARQPRSSARREAVKSASPRREHAAPLDYQAHMQSQTLQERVAASLSRTARATFGEAPDVDAQTFNTGWDALVGEHDLPHGFLEQLTRDGSPNAQGESSTDSARSSAARDGGNNTRDGQQPRTPTSVDQGGNGNNHAATVSDAQPAYPHNGHGAGFGDSSALSQPSRTQVQPPGLPFAQALNRLEDVLGYSAGASGVAASDALAPDAPLPVTPAITPTPMLTPPRVESNVPAIATATVWRGAQAEVPSVSISDDDMPRLAEMMKRILDADARRHGIDV